MQAPAADRCVSHKFCLPRNVFCRYSFLSPNRWYLAVSFHM